MEKIADLLKWADKCTLRNDLRWNANLNSKDLELYSNMAFKLGYLKQDNSKYVLTEEGRRFLKAYDALREENTKIQQTYRH